MSIKRINEFPEGSGSLSPDDLFLFMDDPNNGGVTKKISLSQLNIVLGDTFLSAGDNISSLNNDSKYIVSNTGNIPGSNIVLNVIQMSQQAYDALESYDPNTIYFIE